MAKKRERLEIINDMLKVITDSNNRMKPTRLLYTSNLSPQMFKEYSKELLDKQLIEEVSEKNKRYYKVTDKGFRFLERYKIFSEFVEELGL